MWLLSKGLKFWMMTLDIIDTCYILFSSIKISISILHKSSLQLLLFFRFIPAFWVQFFIFLLSFFHLDYFKLRTVLIPKDHNVWVVIIYFTILALFIDLLKLCLRNQLLFIGKYRFLNLFIVDHPNQTDIFGVGLVG